MPSVASDLRFLEQPTHPEHDGGVQQVESIVST